MMCLAVASMSIAHSKKMVLEKTATELPIIDLLKVKAAPRRFCAFHPSMCVALLNSGKSDETEMHQFTRQWGHFFHAKRVFYVEWLRPHETYSHNSIKHNGRCWTVLRTMYGKGGQECGGNENMMGASDNSGRLGVVARACNPAAWRPGGGSRTHCVWCVVCSGPHSQSQMETV